MTQRLAVLSVQEVVEKMEQDKLVLRSTEARHTRKFRQYVMEQFMTGDVFIPPIVASENDDILHIIDGSSRLRALVELISNVDRMFLSDNAEDQKRRLN